MHLKTSSANAGNLLGLKCQVSLTPAVDSNMANVGLMPNVAKASAITFTNSVQSKMFALTNDFGDYENKIEYTYFRKLWIRARWNSLY